jgi:hypothetical protein
MPPTDLILSKANLMSSRDSLRRFFIDSTVSSLQAGNNTIGPESFYFSPEQSNVISLTQSVMESNPNNSWHSIFVDTLGNTVGSSLNIAGQTPLAGIGIVDITSVLPEPKFPFPTSKEEATRWLLSEALSELGYLKPDEPTPAIPSQEDLDKISELNIASATAWIASKIGVSIPQPPEIPKLPQIPTFSLLDLPGYEKLKEYSQKLLEISSQIPTSTSDLENLATNELSQNIPGIPPIPSQPPFPGIPPIPAPPQIPGIPPIPGLAIPGIILGFLEIPLNVIKSFITDINAIIELALKMLSDVSSIPMLIIDQIFKQIEKIPYIKDILNHPVKPKLFISSFLSVIKFLTGAIGAVLVGSILGAGSISSSIPNLVSNLF